MIQLNDGYEYQYEAAEPMIQVNGETILESKGMWMLYQDGTFVDSFDNETDLINWANN